MRPDWYPYLLAAVSRDNVLPLTSRCNLGCIFCSNRQNPPGINTFRLPPLDAETVLEAASFLSPGRRIIIGESATRIDEGEPFTHPEILSLLENVRRLFPGTLLSITTNGTLLTPEVARRLAALWPIELTLSINSITAHGRRLLLCDPEPGRATGAVLFLEKSGLPFHGSVVAMPHLTGMDDLYSTICYLIEHGAMTVRLFLPGFTRYAPEELRFPLSLWDELKELARQITGDTGVPVTPEPAPPGDFIPEIWGVMRGTPAMSAGLLSGDVVVAVDGRKARTRAEAFGLARKASNPVLRVQRGGQEFTVKLQKARGDAPGFVMLHDFDTDRLDDLAKTIRRRQAVAPLFLTSRLGEQLVGKAVEMIGYLPDSVRAVNNLFFGGTIMAAGLLVIDDLLAAARAALAGRDYDLVVVPREAFDHTGRDLTGQSLPDREERTGIPICQA